MPLNTRNAILKTLNDLELSDLRARPFDCSFELLAAPPSHKRLIMIGFNGSLADDNDTNAGAVRTGYEQPTFSNVVYGLKKRHWGRTPLASRLIKLPDDLGFDSNTTVYTNALLLCSANAASITKAAQKSSLACMKLLTHRSMIFFEHVTMSLAEPELIIAYSNGLSSPSAAKILWERFGNGQPLDHVDTSAYYATYGFTATIGGRKVPVVGIRHMSRFVPNTQAIQLAWERQKRFISNGSIHEE
ncbi:hypothetical protein [Pseudomonas pisciculturae]|uniref:hypothetical protein n=1 Tax=Pseudomonas pisciculturae TaxID=2730413 RepID=UPI001E55781D|nr:hypothetical protein [Pseudomonas pisciculturae]